MSLADDLGLLDGFSTDFSYQKLVVKFANGDLLTMQLYDFHKHLLVVKCPNGEYKPMGYFNHCKFMDWSQSYFFSFVVNLNGH